MYLYLYLQSSIGNTLSHSSTTTTFLHSSRLEVPAPGLNYRQQVWELANESLDSNDGEYEGNDGQSESQESKEENELSRHEDDKDHQSAWGV